MDGRRCPARRPIRGRRTRSAATWELAIMRRMRRASPLVLACGALAGCGDDGDGGSATARPRRPSLAGTQIA